MEEESEAPFIPNYSPLENNQYLIDMFKEKIVRPKYDVNCKRIISHDMVKTS